MRSLTFNLDGTISPEQLEGMPQEFIERVQSAEFLETARREIQERETLQRALTQVRVAAMREHQERRPDGISGRQRKRLRRIVRKMINATISSKGGN